MRIALFATTLIFAACVDSSTGTGVDTSGNNGASSTDPTGSWNATQYTLTSKADAAVAFDYPSNAQAVTAVFTADSAKVTIQQPLGPPAVFAYGLSTLGDSMTWGKPSGNTPAPASGKFVRNGTTMTLDLQGPGITYDFNHDGQGDPALLHAVLVTH